MYLFSYFGRVFSICFCTHFPVHFFMHVTFLNCVNRFFKSNEKIYVKEESLSVQT